MFLVMVEWVAMVLLVWLVSGYGGDRVDVAVIAVTVVMGY